MVEDQMKIEQENQKRKKKEEKKLRKEQMGLLGKSLSVIQPSWFSFVVPYMSLFKTLRMKGSPDHGLGLFHQSFSFNASVVLAPNPEKNSDRHLIIISKRLFLAYSVFVLRLLFSTAKILKKAVKKYEFIFSFKF